jgi:hypothetical protein
VSRSFGKKFHEVRVEGERARGPPEETRPRGPLPVIDPREISAQWEREHLHEARPSEQKRSRKPREIASQNKPSSEPAPPVRPRTGRKPLVPKLSTLVRELIDQGTLQGKSKKEITALVREKAHERLKNDFYGPNSPSKPTVYAALVAAGWPPPDEK